ncbi:MAG: alpha-amylase family glycosyl hydrolase, partial [Aureibaculum sp.]
MKNFVSILILIYSISMISQIERVEPLNWWIGFEETDLQLLVKGDKISEAIPEINWNGVHIINIAKGNSPNYLFLDLNIKADVKPGKFDIIFKFKNGKKTKHTYELKERRRPSSEFIGFNTSDVIYLITPDRFANGDPTNNIFKNLKEKTIDRKDDYARHGGDIKGIIDHLDYIDEMGFTAIWSTPLLTNDMIRTSYHGYAITDLYQVDPRFGTLEEYIDLSKKASHKGIKLVMDQVANHCGVEHWWMKDLPFNDWVNYQKDFENKVDTKYSNHRRTSNQDMYASQMDNEKMSDGWFASSMPDLNQKNPFMAKYLIQNSIWWIETLDLGGI